MSTSSRRRSNWLAHQPATIFRPPSSPASPAPSTPPRPSKTRFQRTESVLRVPPPPPIFSRPKVLSTPTANASDPSVGMAAIVSTSERGINDSPLEMSALPRLQTLLFRTQFALNRCLRSRDAPVEPLRKGPLAKGELRSTVQLKEEQIILFQMDTYHQMGLTPVQFELMRKRAPLALERPGVRSLEQNVPLRTVVIGGEEYRYRITPSDRLKFGLPPAPKDLRNAIPLLTNQALKSPDWSALGLNERRDLALALDAAALARQDAIDSKVISDEEINEEHPSTLMPYEPTALDEDCDETHFYTSFADVPRPLRSPLDVSPYFKKEAFCSRAAQLAEMFAKVAPPEQNFPTTSKIEELPEDHDGELSPPSSPSFLPNSKGKQQSEKKRFTLLAQMHARSPADFGRTPALQHLVMPVHQIQNAQSSSSGQDEQEVERSLSRIVEADDDEEEDVSANYDSISAALQAAREARRPIFMSSGTQQRSPLNFAPRSQSNLINFLSSVPLPKEYEGEEEQGEVVNDTLSNGRAQPSHFTSEHTANEDISLPSQELTGEESTIRALRFWEPLFRNRPPVSSPLPPSSPSPSSKRKRILDSDDFSTDPLVVDDEVESPSKKIRREDDESLGQRSPSPEMTLNAKAIHDIQQAMAAGRSPSPELPIHVNPIELERNDNRKRSQQENPYFPYDFRIRYAPPKPEFWDHTTFETEFAKSSVPKNREEGVYDMGANPAFLKIYHEIVSGQTGDGFPLEELPQVQDEFEGGRTPTPEPTPYGDIERLLQPISYDQPIQDIFDTLQSRRYGLEYELQKARGEVAGTLAECTALEGAVAREVEKYQETLGLLDTISGREIVGRVMEDAKLWHVTDGNAFELPYEDEVEEEQ